MYLRQTISVSGTEADFLKAFVKSLTDLNIGITCDTDIDAALSDNSETATIILSFFGMFDLKLKREHQNGQSENDYVISDNDGRLSIYPNVPARLYFSNSAYTKTQIATRTWAYDIISDVNNRIFLINFGSFHRAPPTYPNRDHSFIFVRDPGGVAYRYNINNTGAALTDLPLLLSDDSTAVKYDRLGYIYDAQRPASLEIVRKKVYRVNSSINVAFTTTRMMDVSNVTAGSLVTFDGKRYYALDSYTLMEM